MMHGRGQALCLTHSRARGTVSLSYQEEEGYKTMQLRLLAPQHESGSKLRHRDQGTSRPGTGN